MKKVLFVATVVKLHINVFHIPYLKMFKENGYEVHVCAKNDFENKEDCIIPYCDSFFDVNFGRMPFSRENVNSYKKLKNILVENDYDIVHCHTPVGAAITRLAAKNLKKNDTKIVYTAHGFHFYQGAPLKNWLLFYPIEKYLSRYTDTIITINKEDYDIANNNFHSSHIALTDGVGINLSKFNPTNQENKIALRKANGFDESDKILIYVGELSNRKNQKFLINVMEETVKMNSNIKLLLVGNGKKGHELIEYVKEKNLASNVFFLGFRSDISDLMKLSDIAVSSSKQEGLPVNIMEAMATGLPIIASNCRGNRDLIEDGVNGYLVQIDDSQMFLERILKLIDNNELCEAFQHENLKKVKKYSLDNVSSEMSRIYKESLNLV